MSLFISTEEAGPVESQCFHKPNSSLKNKRWLNASPDFHHAENTFLFFLRKKILCASSPIFLYQNIPEAISLSTTNIRCSIESISCCSCWVPNKFNSTLLQSWTSLLIRRCSKCLWKRKWDTVHEVHRMYYWRAHCVHIDSIMHFIMRVYSRVCGLCFLKCEHEQLLQCHGVSELLQVFFCCTWIWINTKWDTENDSSLSSLSSLSCHLIVMFFD